jgi:hypothetical protein
MTFDASINTTYGEAMAQIRDKISSMANWSVKDSNYSTDSTAFTSGGDYYVLTTPEGSDVKIGATNSGTVELQHGPEWDASAGSWADQYSQSWRAAPENLEDYGSTGWDFQVRWWIEYVDNKGWAFFMSREAGDGNDEAMAMGMSELTRLWDYTTAQVRESKYTALVAGYKSADYNQSAFSAVNATFEGGTSGGTHEGKGQVNADGNNDNFPMVETTIQASSKYEDALIGTHDLWVRDNSGDRSAHLDTVTDSGANEYKLFKESLPTTIGIRMD